MALLLPAGGHLEAFPSSGGEEEGAQADQEDETHHLKDSLNVKGLCRSDLRGGSGETDIESGELGETVIECENLLAHLLAYISSCSSNASCYTLDPRVTHHSVTLSLSSPSRATCAGS